LILIIDNAGRDGFVVLLLVLPDQFSRFLFHVSLFQLEKFCLDHIWIF